MRRADAFIACALLATAAISACDPCSGVASCSESPRVSLQGRIVDAVDGHFVSGARIAVVGDGGVVATTDSVTTMTDATGAWSVTIPAQSSGDGTVDVVVDASDSTAYRAKNVAVTATTRLGDGQILPLWVNREYFPDAGEIYYRARPDSVVENTAIEFQRTSGAELTGPGWSLGFFLNQTDEHGRVPFFGQIVFPKTDEAVFGDVVALLPPPLGASVVHNVKITPTHLFHPPGNVIRVGVGPNLNYVARLYVRATSAPVAGARVSFTRTGGIDASPSSFSVQSDASGSFALPIMPLANGTLVGDLTIQPAGAATPIVVQGVQLPTYEADGPRFLATYGVGPHLPWNGIVHAGGKGIAGVRVTATRVSGINVSPTTVVSTSDADGVFRLNAFVPQTAGDLIVDLQFQPPAPYAAFTVHNVVLHALDVDANAFIVGTWDVDRPNPIAAATTRPAFRR